MRQDLVRRCLPSGKACVCVHVSVSIGETILADPDGRFCFAKENEGTADSKREEARAHTRAREKAGESESCYLVFRIGEVGLCGAEGRAVHTAAVSTDRYRSSFPFLVLSQIYGCTLVRLDTNKVQLRGSCFVGRQPHTVQRAGGLSQDPLPAQSSRHSPPPAPHQKLPASMLWRESFQLKVRPPAEHHSAVNLSSPAPFTNTITFKHSMLPLTVASVPLLQ
eukprot:916939-Rhodomonas_salina.1